MTPLEQIARKACEPGKHYGVCSPKPRPAVQNNHSRFGHEHWGRDVWHITESGKTTLCGINSSGWILMDELAIDRHCCKRCVNKAALSARPNLEGEG